MRNLKITSLDYIFKKIFNEMKRKFNEYFFVLFVTDYIIVTIMKNCRKEKVRMKEYLFRFD